MELDYKELVRYVHSKEQTAKSQHGKLFKFIPTIIALRQLKVSHVIIADFFNKFLELTEENAMTNKDVIRWCSNWKINDANPNHKFKIDWQKVEIERTRLESSKNVLHTVENPKKFLDKSAVTFEDFTREFYKTARRMLKTEEKTGAQTFFDSFKDSKELTDIVNMFIEQQTTATYN